MKTRRAIFWATMVIVLTLSGHEVEGVAKIVAFAAIGVSLLMLLLQTLGENEDD